MILFDLDGTLLDIDLNQFIPYYVKFLAKKFAPGISPEDFDKKIMKATFLTMKNASGKNNYEYFFDVFTPMINRPRSEIESILVDFYTNEFSILKKFVNPRPQSRQVVQQALDLGVKIVLATSPLFPRAAIQARMQWAGIADLPFHHITDIENCSASKSQLKYYQDLFAYLKVRPDRSLMVGDDKDDLRAGLLGCATFLVQSPMTTLDDTLPPPTFRGTLQDLSEILQKYHP